MYLEDLVGRPSYELLPLIADANDVRQFYLTGVREKTYDQPNTVYPFDVQQLAPSDWYAQIRASLPPKEFLGLASRVLLKAGFRHVPMLDYDDVKLGEKASVSELEALLEELHLPPGAVISSGNGLHYIGALTIHDLGFYKLIQRIQATGFIWEGGMMADRENPGVDLKFLHHGQFRGYFELRLSEAEVRPQQPVITRVYRPRKGISMEGARDYGLSMMSMRGV